MKHGNFTLLKKCVLAVIVVMVLVSGCSQKKTDFVYVETDTDTDTEKSADGTTELTDVGHTKDTKEEADKTQIVIEELREENSNPEELALLRDWNSIVMLPSDKEIEEFNTTSVSRSPYLVGWLGIEPEMRFSEYSIDFKADYLPYGTYFSCANIKMDLSTLEQEYEKVSMDSWLSFYAGVQMWEPEKGSGSIMSFWDINCEDSSGEISQIHAKLVYPEEDAENVFSHEGNGVNYLHDYVWEEGCWYRMLLQCGKSEENGHTLVEQWICNLQTGEWTKLCCYDTGLINSCFVGDMAVFLENYIPKYAGDVRTVEFKNIRIRPDGTEQWIPISRIVMSKEDGFGFGSYCFGADDEQFWMITTGLENRSGQQVEKAAAYQVTTYLSDSPHIIEE